MTTEWAEQPVNTSDWLKHWNDPELSFEGVVIKGGVGKLESGTVLKNVGEVYEPAQAGDTFAGILRIRKDAAGVANIKGVIVRWGAVITPYYLSWHVSVDTQVKKQAILDQMAAQQIDVRGDA